MKDLGLLLIRLVVGGLVAGHGAQKLFGAFGGHGLEGTRHWLKSLGLRPGRAWAWAAGLSEFGGGLLTALGLFQPLGPIGLMASMSMATGKAHWGKPIWVTEGGAELPVVNIAVGLGLAAAGPGRYSLDGILGIRVPAWLAGLAAVVAVAALIMGIQARPAPQPTGEQRTSAEVQAGVGAATP